MHSSCDIYQQIFYVLSTTSAHLHVLPKLSTFLTFHLCHDAMQYMNKKLQKKINKTISNTHKNCSMCINSVSHNYRLLHFVTSVIFEQIFTFYAWNILNSYRNSLCINSNASGYTTSFSLAIYFIDARIEVCAYDIVANERDVWTHH